MDSTQSNQVFDLGTGASRKFNFETGFIPYWNVFWLFLALSGFSALIEPLIGYRSVGYILLLGVLFVGSVGAAGPVFFAAFLSALIWNFLFIPPRFTFNINRADDIILCVTYFASAVVTGVLTKRIRESEAFNRLVEKRTERLFAVLKQLAEGAYQDRSLEKVLRSTGMILNGDCGIVLVGPDGQLSREVVPLGIQKLEKREYETVDRAFKKKEETEWPTLFDTEAQIVAFPLTGARETIGVFIFRPRQKGPLSEDQKTILRSVSRQIAMFMETKQTRLRLDESHVRTSIGTEPKRSDESLLKTLNEKEFSPQEFPLKKESVRPLDLIGFALEASKSELVPFSVAMEVPHDLPLVQADAQLLGYALASVLRESLSESPKETRVRLDISLRNKNILFSFEDEGPPLEERNIARSQEGTVIGTRRPISPDERGRIDIARKIVEAHGGRLLAQNKIEGGVRFVISLRA